MDPPFKNDEKRFLLAEIIKVSHLDIAILLEYVYKAGIRPDWYSMQLPAGRNLNYCLRLWESISQPLPQTPVNLLLDCGDQEKRFVLAEMIKVSHLDVTTLADFMSHNAIRPDWLSIQLPSGRNMNQCIRAWEGLSKQFLKREGDYEPRPSFNMQLANTTSQSMITASGTKEESFPPLQSSDGSLMPRKRGRPSRADMEARTRQRAAHPTGYAPIAPVPGGMMQPQRKAKHRTPSQTLAPFLPLESQETATESPKPGTGSFVTTIVGTNPAYSDSGYGSRYGLDWRNEGLVDEDNPKSSPLQAVEDSVPSEARNTADIEDSTQDLGALSPTLSDAGSFISRVTKYADAFADELLEELGKDLDGPNWEKLQETLPHLLKEFAVRISHEGKTWLHRELGRVAYTSYRTITARLGRARNDATCADSSDENDKEEDAPDYKERIELLDKTMNDPSHEEENLYHGKELHSIDIEPWFQILSTSGAMIWLKQSIQSNIHLRGIEPLTQNFVRDTVLGSIRLLRNSTRIKAHDISRRRNPSCYDLVFDLDWDPLRYILAQEYSQNAEDTLGRVLTLTGDGNIVQACSSMEYMKQTWPSTGPTLLQLIATFLKNVSTPQHGDLGDNTKVTISMSDGHLCIQSVGTCYGLAQLAEQLCWMGAAMQIPPDVAGLGQFSSIPHLDLRWDEKKGGLAPTIDTSLHPVAAGRCYISFHVERLRDPGECDTRSGRCWENLFRNFVVACGFPVPNRADARGGMEASLDVIATLIQAEWLSVFKNRLVAKGFSRLFYATDLVNNDTLFWHLVSNEDHGRISYADPRVLSHQGFTDAAGLLERIKNGRLKHIVGWSSQVKNYIGAHDALYNIRASELPTPPAKGAFDKLQLGFSMYLSGSVSINLGKKDKPLPYVKEKPYAKKLEWISNRFVILHDVGTHIAYLADGASALLHLVRTSLHYDSGNPLRRFLKSNEVSLHEVDIPHTGAEAAVEFLTNIENMRLPLRASQTFNRENPLETKEAVEEFLVDRIEHIMHTIEVIIDQQASAAADDGIQFQLKSDFWMKNLEGFDFNEIARQSPPYMPKVAEIAPAGQCWISLARALKAIVLFGKGFGSLIQPAEAGDSVACRSCHWDCPVPKDQDLLVVCERDLERLLYEGKGEKQGDCWRLVDNIYWDSPENAFEPCRCNRPGRKTSRSVHRIQGLRVGRQPSTPGTLLRNTERTISSLLRGSQIAQRKDKQGANGIDAVPGQASATYDILHTERAILFGQNIGQNLLRRSDRRANDNDATSEASPEDPQILNQAIEIAPNQLCDTATSHISSEGSSNSSASKWVINRIHDTPDTEISQVSDKLDGVLSAATSLKRKIDSPRSHHHDDKQMHQSPLQQPAGASSSSENNHRRLRAEKRNRTQS